MSRRLVHVLDPTAPGTRTTARSLCGRQISSASKHSQIPSEVTCRRCRARLNDRLERARVAAARAD